MKNVKFWLSHEGQAILSGWARAGLGIAELAERMGVTSRTLAGWVGRYPEIGRCVYSGEENVALMVEGAILKKALGFDVTEKKSVIKASGDEETTAVTKHIPPDVSAGLTWLKICSPEKWGGGDRSDSSRIEEILARLDEEAEEGDAEF